MFNRRPPVKMGYFHGEATFISVFGGTRDIFETQFKHTCTIIQM
jgi:hypothetical protein